MLPFLPYLLQDFWSLGVDPAEYLALIRKHEVDRLESRRLLDLGCGKGAVSVTLAKRDCSMAMFRLRKQKPEC